MGIESTWMPNWSVSFSFWLLDQINIKSWDKLGRFSINKILKKCEIIIFEYCGDMFWSPDPVCKGI